MPPSSAGGVAQPAAATVANHALVRIGLVLGVDPKRPASRLELLQRFQALDANGNGILSRDELIDGLNAAGVRLTKVGRCSRLTLL